MVFITELLIFKQAPQKRDGRHVSHAADAEKASNRKSTFSKQETIFRPDINRFLFYRPIGRGPHAFMPSRQAADLEWLRAAAMATTIPPIWQSFGDAAAKAHPKTGAARWKLLQTWLLAQCTWLLRQPTPIAQSYVLYKMRVFAR
ncbi:hypothetical protein [Vandammella animalimorsus]|uniref:hypothetical protein n=1 Tax=Vandammella animalimorsus TaxID=2029117 RepID=UPI001177374A|nr:hypothetical protein [Vandammella animalimorsus]